MGKKNSTKPELTEAQKKQKKIDNFARVLPRRMDKALKAIRMVGECTLPTYTYTRQQREAIIDKLFKAVIEVKARYEGIQGKSGGFELPK